MVVGTTSTRKRKPRSPVPTPLSVQIVDDVVSASVKVFEEILRTATQDDRIASIAVSGGTTPWQVFAALAKKSLPWERVRIYQVDERIVPYGDPRRNLTQLEAVFLTQVPAQCYPLPVDDPDLIAALLRYEASLPAAFDLVHLGLGEDGHTASLVPNDPVLDDTSYGVAITNPYQGVRRATLTYPVLNRAKHIVWIVSGEAKRHALEHLLTADQTIPASAVNRERATVITDIAVSGDSRGVEDVGGGPGE